MITGATFDIAPVIHLEGDDAVILSTRPLFLEAGYVASSDAGVLFPTKRVVIRKLRPDPFELTDDPTLVALAKLWWVYELSDVPPEQVEQVPVPTEAEVEEINRTWEGTDGDKKKMPANRHLLRLLFAR